jgi:hypothetical protein
VNGIVISGSLYTSAGINQQNNGMVILAVPAGSIITISNQSPPPGITLPAFLNGGVNASVLITKLA